MAGLLDETEPAMERKIRDLLETEVNHRAMSYHNFRYRHSGMTHWVEFHLVVDDQLSVSAAHLVATEIEASVAKMLYPNGRVISHLEPKSAEHNEECWEVP
jgi:ferrous-iron efflux pump FieF